MRKTYGRSGGEEIKEDRYGGSRFRDLKWAMRYLPQIEIVKIPNMMHGEFVMMHPEEFALKAMDFLQ